MSDTNALLLQQSLIDSCNAYAEGIDSKNWAMVRACFDDQVALDYGELSAAGGAPDVLQSADDWVKVLQSAINGFDITRHTMTNHRISLEGDTACCRVYLDADHVIFSHPELLHALDGDVVRLVGEYTNHYRQTDAGWKIIRSKLAVHWTSGEAELFARSAQRAAENAA
ncbi:hypothetical protein SIN8267_03207 [Sinobacterium norvegicum]|uniref:SnoaL-like domain-containing protein n=1 Tax=Sinobacterium norvegicum TaxID=1641715 RepID=A0ABN8EQ02_9GAMM|nr:nuclear transport factor 2 family protein [Sinobacterium norvegicum]CAH0993068.1 hypothetical protein SIN8267_03207 [Sinobacterium norvegicum]